METGEIKKYIKQVRDEANEDMEKYLGVLNEAHAENLKGIRDGFTLVDLRFDRVDKRLDRIEDKLEIREEIEV
jgi:hypothetical protein